MFAATLRRLTVPMAALLFLAAAPPPPVKMQSPGFYRMAVGKFEVTALYDGNLRLAPQLLHGIDASAVPPLLAREFVDTNEKGVATSLNAYLVNTGDHLILVDSGMGSCGGPETGHVVENLKAAGYRPEDVDVVLVTHLHGDHACGLLKDRAPVFPKAMVYAAEAEIAYWFTPVSGTDALSQYRGQIRQALAPLQSLHVLQGFKPGAVLFPGVTTLDTHGHTPGHTSYLFQSAGQSFVVLGDIAHFHAVQFTHPEVTVDFDSDQPAALQTRKALFDRLAKEGWRFGGAHLPFPGIGHVRKGGDAYTYVPVEYAPLP